MKAHGNIDLLGNKLQNITLDSVNSFPIEPVVGSFIFKDKRIMVCVDFNELPIWIPLTQELDTYVHTQNEAEASWIIPHNLNTSTVMVQVFDENNNVVIPDNIDTSNKDTTIISFSNYPLMGRAILMIGNFTGLAKPDVRYEANFPLESTWIVNHGLGYNPVVRALSGGYEIQPESIEHTSTTTAIVKFSNPVKGSIICL